MKLLYINDAIAIYGGLERVLIEKINWFVEQAGYEVCLLTTNQGDHPFSFSIYRDVICRDLSINFHQQYRYSGLKRIRLNLRLHRIFRQRLRKVLLELRPDIIICTRLAFLWDVVNVKKTIPCIFESHASRFASFFEGDSWKSRLLIFLMQCAVMKVEQVVALTKGDAKEWYKLTSKVSVIPNPVHLNGTGCVCDYNSKSIIFVGRFSKQKDIGTLLQIWEMVYQRYSDWHLHIYGGYGEKQEELLTKINHVPGVVVHGQTANMINEYKKSSILLLTSLYEPFGLVLPEAMSCGLPVVSFDCPYGPSDIISNGMDGYLISNRNINDFVDKVCLLIENKELRRKMGMSGVLSSCRYSADQVMSKWQSLFYQII